MAQLVVESNWSFDREMCFQSSEQLLYFFPKRRHDVRTDNEKSTDDEKSLFFVISIPTFLFPSCVSATKSAFVAAVREGCASSQDGQIGTVHLDNLVA